MPARIFCALAFLLFAHCAHAQDPDDRISSIVCPSPSASPACRELFEGYRLVDTWRYPQASSAFEKVLDRALADQNPALEVQARLGLAETLTSQSRYQEANPQLETSEQLLQRLNDPHSLARVHERLGVAAYWLKGRSAALELVTTAKQEYAELSDRPCEVRALIEEVIYETNLDRENILLAEAEQLITSVASPKVRALVSYSRGEWFFELGNYDMALQHYNEARQLSSRAGDLFELARIYTSIGRLYRAQGRPELSPMYYRKALAIQKKISDTNGAIQSLNAIGVAYDACGYPQKAAETYVAALREARINRAERYINFELGNLGTEYASLGQYARGITILRYVIAHDDDPTHVAYRNHALAKALFALHKYTEALQSETNALEFRRQHKLRRELVDSLNERALILDRLNRGDEAQADMLEALRTIEEIRSHLVPSDYLKQGFADDVQSVYDTAIEIAFQHKQFAKALEIAEGGRARAFLDLLATRSSAKTLAEAESHSNSVEPGGLAADSTAYAVPYTATEFSDSVRTHHTTVLCYWLAEHALFIWVANPEGQITGVRVRADRSQITSLIDQATSERVQLGSDEAATVPQQKTKPWRELYRILIQPIEKQLPPRDALLTIIPHSELVRLPFAALQDLNGRYLVERHSLHYLPAAALFRYTEETQTRTVDTKSRFLFVVNDAPGKAEDKNLPALGGTFVEASAISKLLPSRDVHILRQPADTVEAVEAAMPTSTVVHFATHAVMDKSDPLNSFLLLSADSNARAKNVSDGRLTAAAIYDLKIPADLVVLSACSTAQGKVSSEAITGFSRAFFTAGAGSVLATLWNVADDPTQLLMIEFYRRLEQGQTKAEALREAQLYLLRLLRQGRVHINSPLGAISLPPSPKFWAAFVLQGNPQ